QNVAAGAKIVLPDEVKNADGTSGEATTQGQRAVYQLYYRREGATGNQDYRVAEFNLHIAGTNDQRDQWLSADALDSLGLTDGLLVYYESPRKLRLSVRDLGVTKPFYLLPFSGDPSAAVTPQTVVEIRPFQRRAANEPGPEEDWMQ